MADVDNSKTPLLLRQLSLDSVIGDNLRWAQLLQATLVSAAWFFDAQQTFLNVFDDPTTSAGGLPASSFFAGCLAGGLILSTAADSSLGRKYTLFLSTLAMALSGLLTAATTTGDVRTYSLLRFVAGVARSAVGTAALVLSTELVGRRWRGRVGVAGFVFFTLGFLSLPAMAYLELSLYVWTSVPALIYAVVVFFFVHESPRWLLVQGRKEEAIATLKKLGTNNIVDGHEISLLSTVSLDDGEWTVKILFNKKWALRRLLAISAIGFGIGLVYYGMPLALGDLGFSLYLTVTLNALSELPASMIAFFLIGKLNRRSSLLFFTSLSGVCSVVLAVAKRHVVFASLRVGLELLSFFGACTAFDVVLIFTVELFPTSVRNTAVSVARQAMVLGGVFGPPLAAAGGDGLVSYGVFGVVIGCCGLFVVCLPETRGRGICDTMDEEEKKNNCLGIC